METNGIKIRGGNFVLHFNRFGKLVREDTFTDSRWVTINHTTPKERDWNAEDEYWWDLLSTD